MIMQILLLVAEPFSERMLPAAVEGLSPTATFPWLGLKHHGQGNFEN